MKLLIFNVYNIRNKLYLLPWVYRALIYDLFMI